jgi:signal transduction histidine kinase
MLPKILTPSSLSEDHSPLQALIHLSQSGLGLLRPCYTPGNKELEDFNLEFLNPTAQHLFHLPAQPAQTLRTLLPSAQKASIWAFCQTAFQFSEPSKLEVPFPTSAGTRQLHIVAQRYGDYLLVDCTASATAGHTLDTMDTDQRLGKEGEIFYQVFEQTQALIALVRGPEHRFAYCNVAYQQLFPERQLQGHTVAEALPEARAQGFVELLDRVFQTGETYFGSEMAFATAPARGEPSCIRYFNFTHQAYREQGQTVGVSIFSYDVTEQVVARQQREAQQRQLHELFEQAPVSICLFGGPDFVYELASQQHQQLFPDRQLVGQPLLTAVPELAGQPVWSTLQKVYHTGVTEVDLGVCVPLARRQGAALEDSYFDYIFQARHNAAGNIDGVLVFAFDVTEQVFGRRRVQELNEELRAANQELRTANQQLVYANTDLASFVYTASHDLKTPIANIEGLLTMLRNQLPLVVQQDEMITQILAMMQQAVERFQLTIAQLTDVTRLQLSPSQLAENVDLAALVENVRLDLSLEQAATEAQLQFDIAACPTIVFVPKHLRSIIYNLLSNAVKYRAPDRDPVVQLRAHRSLDQSAAVLEVQDNGLGLSEAQQGKLFGLFRRLHDHVQGTGMGLYIVKKIVENAGGTITVRSQPDIGSTFTVVLPD